MGAELKAHKVLKAYKDFKGRKEPKAQQEQAHKVYREQPALRDPRELRG
jgi:hypothetical protein